MFTSFRRAFHTELPAAESDSHQSNVCLHAHEWQTFLHKKMQQRLILASLMLAWMPTSCRHAFIQSHSDSESCSSLMFMSGRREFRLFLRVARAHTHSSTTSTLVHSTQNQLVWFQTNKIQKLQKIEINEAYCHALCLR